MQNSIVYRTILYRFSSGVTVTELVSVLEVVYDYAKKMYMPNECPLPKPKRNEKRTLRGILTYFSNNWQIVQPILNRTQLCDRDFRPINAEREMLEKKIV